MVINVNLNEGHLMLQDLAREFADRELIPNAEDWDRNGTFPAEAIQKLSLIHI